MREQIAQHTIRRASLQGTQVNKSAARPAPTTEDDPYSEGDYDYSEPTRMPTSARKYNYPVQPAPVRQRQAAPPPAKRSIHPLIWLVAALLIMLLGWTAFNTLGSLVQSLQENATYGYPRTFQVDANVGHNGRTSHFICLNLRGEIQVIELQAGHPESAKIYTVLVLPADQDRVPCTLTFTDINGDGKTDMLVHIGNSTEIPMYNNGSTFQSQPPK